MRSYPTPIGELPSVTWILGETVQKPWFPNYMKKWARECFWDMVNNRSINSIQPINEPCKIHGNFGVHNCPDCIKSLEVEYIPNIEISDIQYCLDAHKRHSEKALEIGSWIHNAIEIYHTLWDDNEWFLEVGWNSLQITELSKFSYYVSFIREYYPDFSDILQTYFNALNFHNIKVLESEQTVWHPMGYAGTLDLICEMDGKLWIGDIKTFESKQYKDGRPKKPLFKKEHYAQTEAYRRAYNDGMCRNCHENEMDCYPDQPSDCPHIQNRFILWLDKRDQSNYYLEIIDESLNEKHWDMFVKAYEMFKAWK